MWPCVRHVFWCPEYRGVSSLFSGVSRSWGVSALFSGVSRLSRCVRLVFWCVQTFAVCPPCFLVCPDYLGVSTCLVVCAECGRVSALFSVEYKLSRGVRFVFWYVQKVLVCPPCPPCPEYYGVSACLLVCPEYLWVSTMFSGVSRLSCGYVFWCFQNVLVCPPCFLVCQECCGVLILLSSMSRLSRFLCRFFWCM